MVQGQGLLGAAGESQVPRRGCLCHEEENRTDALASQYLHLLWGLKREGKEQKL